MDPRLKVMDAGLIGGVMTAFSFSFFFDGYIFLGFLIGALVVSLIASFIVSRCA